MIPIYISVYLYTYTYWFPLSLIILNAMRSRRRPWLLWSLSSPRIHTWNLSIGLLLLVNSGSDTDLSSSINCKILKWPKTQPRLWQPANILVLKDAPFPLHAANFRAFQQNKVHVFVMSLKTCVRDVGKESWRITTICLGFTGCFYSIFFHHKILQERYRCSQKYESFLSTHMFILWLFYSSVCLPAAEFWNSLSLSYRLISVNLGRPSNATIYTEWIWLNAFRSVSWIQPI